MFKQIACASAGDLCLTPPQHNAFFVDFLQALFLGYCAVIGTEHAESESYEKYSSARDQTVCPLNCTHIGSTNPFLPSDFFIEQLRISRDDYARARTAHFDAESAYKSDLIEALKVFRGDTFASLTDKHRNALIDYAHNAIRAQKRLFATEFSLYDAVTDSQRKIILAFSSNMATSLAIFRSAAGF